MYYDDDYDSEASDDVSYDYGQCLNYNWDESDDEEDDGTYTGYSGDASNSSWWEERHSGGIHKDMSVDDIFYTHAVISRRFRTNRDDKDAPPDGPLLEDTFRDLIKNPDTIKDIPRVPVMEHKGKYWAVNGNRRLFVYKMLHRFDLIKAVPVRVIRYEPGWFSRAYSTENDGRSVRVQGVSMGEYEKKLNNIYINNRFSHSTKVNVAQRQKAQRQKAAAVPKVEEVEDMRQKYARIYREAQEQKKLHAQNNQSQKQEKRQIIGVSRQNNNMSSQHRTMNPSNRSSVLPSGTRKTDNQDMYNSVQAGQVRLVREPGTLQTTTSDVETSSSRPLHATTQYNTGLTHSRTHEPVSTQDHIRADYRSLSSSQSYDQRFSSGDGRGSCKAEGNTSAENPTTFLGSIFRTISSWFK